MLKKPFRLVFVALISTVPMGCGMTAASLPGTIVPAAKFERANLGVTQVAYSDRETQLTQQGYQYGSQRARDSRQPDVLQALNNLGINDSVGQDAFNHGFAVGYDLENRGYQNGLNDAKSGQPFNPQDWLNRLDLSTPAEQQLYNVAYSRGYQQAANSSSTGNVQDRFKQQGYQSGADYATKGLARNPQTELNRLGITNPSDRDVFTNAFYRGYDLQQQAYQYGQNDANAGRQRYPENWLSNLQIREPAERQIFITAYNKGYQQVGSKPSGDRQARLRDLGYDYGAAQAQRQTKPNPDEVMTNLGITDPTERQIFSDAFMRGFYLANRGYQYGQQVALAGRQPDAEEGLNGLGITIPIEQDIFADAFERGYRSKCRRGAGVGVCALW